MAAEGPGKPVKSLLCGPEEHFFASLAYPDFPLPARTGQLGPSFCIQVPNLECFKDLMTLAKLLRTEIISFFLSP